MGKLNYTTSEIEKAILNVLTPPFFLYTKTDDVPDIVNVLAANTPQVYIPDVTNMVVFLSDDFTYNEVTGENTYTGDGTYLKVEGSATIGDTPNPNTIVHFAMCVNGAEVLVGSGKDESGTGRENISLIGPLTPFPITTGDVITLTSESTKTGDHSIWHVSGGPTLVKPV